jgi:hypothetical protein
MQKTGVLGMLAGVSAMAGSYVPRRPIRMTQKRSSNHTEGHRKKVRLRKIARASRKYNRNHA